MMQKVEHFLSRYKKYSFLAGAGISIDAPANLPSANKIISTIFNYYLPEDEIDYFINQVQIRFEAFIEALSYRIDPDLDFLDYFELEYTPNQIHDFLSEMTLKQIPVITTNFDYGIERALKGKISDERLNDIPLLITEDDFKGFDSSDLSSTEMYPLIKIHGSKTNFFKKIDTKDSLIVKLSDFGKNRQFDQILDLEEYKKRVLTEVVESSTLIVVGYSGGDDFDIVPTLKKIHGIKQILWIEHVYDPEKARSIEFPLESDDADGNRELSTIDEKLNQIAVNREISILKVVMNTKDLFDSILHSYFNYQKHAIEEKIIEMPKFDDWYKDKSKNCHEIEKLEFAARLYYDHKLLDKAQACSEKALEHPDIQKYPRYYSALVNMLGLIHLIEGDYAKSTEYFDLATSKIQEGELAEELLVLQLNRAVVLIHQNHFDEAYSILDQLLKTCKQNNIVQFMHKALGGLGFLFIQLKNFEKAREFLTEANYYAEKNGDLFEISTISGNLATAYVNLQDIRKARRFAEKALEVSEQLRDFERIAHHYGKLAEIEFMAKDFSEALHDYEFAIMNFEKAGSLQDICVALVNSANVTFAYARAQNSMQMLNKGLEYLDDAKERNKKLKNPKIDMLVHENYADYYRSTGDLEKSLSSFEKAHEFARSGNFPVPLCRIQSNMGSIYYQAGYYGEALKWIKKARATAQRNGIASYLQQLDGMIQQLRNMGYS